MHFLDYTIIFGYLFFLVLVGVYFGRNQKSVDEYFVGERKIGHWHIGFSVVATDVGGGFSIGLGGLGFAMGLSGSWLLFTGLVGAFLSAVFLIPVVKSIGDRKGFLTFPDFLESRYDKRVRLIAAFVSGIGYAGFVGGQILAGAKLSTAAFGINLYAAVGIMALVVIGYTALGGLKAVIFTDTIQWGVLLAGLLFFALPVALIKVGGFTGLKSSLPPSYFSFTQISFKLFMTWMLTIIPIWFVGMTLYQRIYASTDLKSAKKAWFIAGLLEWPIMAFSGVVLGMCAKVMFPAVEPEMGLPLLISDVLPMGIMGVVLAAYFSAIMSTADSCLLASSGNFVNDIYQKYICKNAPPEKVLRISKITTVVIGGASVTIALVIPSVLKVILLAYAFMVSGLFVPVVGGLFSKKVSPAGALASMIAGGLTIVIFNLFPSYTPLDEPVFSALMVSLMAIIIFSLIFPRHKT
ncbi:MAG: sodium:solute symporter family protein [Deltaproteobacteria bacterium]|nr:sodium:solute symporter family protein [Deltaproteobacteria bacterium]